MAVREVLLINLELFQRLMELKSGVQISGIAQKAYLANQDFYTALGAGRCVRVYGLHPAEEEQVFRLRGGIAEWPADVDSGNALGHFTGVSSLSIIFNFI